jgi:Zinc finger, ZZ type
MKGLNDTSGIDNLKKYAILMLNGTCDDSSVNLDDYVVVLMYRDTEDDKVLLFTDYDLVAACQEYSLTGKVKILAEVTASKITTDKIDSSRASVSTQTFVFNAEKATQVTVSPSPELPRESSELPSVTSVHVANINAPADVSSSIANILQFAAQAAATAATSKTVTDAINQAASVVEEQAKKAGAAAQLKAQQAHNAVDTGVHKAVRNTERVARQAARSARQAARSARRSVVPTAPTEDCVSQEVCGGNSPTVDATARNSEFVAGQEKDREASDMTAERPFIHGRHTCDGCLTTPIIGNRFHATNKTDYDLCEKCVLNYGGSDMQFEVAQLGTSFCLFSLIELLLLILVIHNPILLLRSRCPIPGSLA